MQIWKKESNVYAAWIIRVSKPATSSLIKVCRLYIYSLCSLNSIGSNLFCKSKLVSRESIFYYVAFILIHDSSLNNAIIFSCNCIFGQTYLFFALFSFIEFLPVIQNDATNVV